MWKPYKKTLGCSGIFTGIYTDQVQIDASGVYILYTHTYYNFNQNSAIK